MYSLELLKFMDNLVGGKRLRYLIAITRILRYKTNVLTNGEKVGYTLFPDYLILLKQFQIGL